MRRGGWKHQPEEEEEEEEDEQEEEEQEEEEAMNVSTVPPSEKESLKTKGGRMERLRLIF